MGLALIVIGGLAVALAGVGAVTILARWCPDPVLAALQLVLPWTAGASLVTGAVSFVTGPPALGVAASIVTFVAGIVLVPRLRPARGRSEVDGAVGPRCTVALANLYLDNDEPEAAVRQLLEQRPDVMVLTELTDELLAAVDRVAGGSYRRRVHPEPLEGEYEPGIFVADGTEVVRTAVRFEGSLPVVEAEVVIDGVSLHVITVHPTAPANRADFARWRAELRELRAVLEATEGPTIAVGDLNAGTLQVPYEALVRRTRFRDAHDLLGVALRPSWGIAPGLPRWVPTLVARLDHLLISPEVRVHDLEDLDPVGSDHRPFVATFSIVG